MDNLWGNPLVYPQSPQDGTPHKTALAHIFHEESKIWHSSKPVRLSPTSGDPLEA